MNSFKDRKNISIANLKSIVGETTQAPCVAESVLENKPVDKLPEQEHAIKDKAGELYSVRFQRSEDLWDIKLLHDGRKIGETNCLRHGENLLLGNIEIFSTAAPPGVMAVLPLSPRCQITEDAALEPHCYSSLSSKHASAAYNKSQAICFLRISKINAICLIGIEGAGLRFG
ncbi:MAG: hypothetical protein ABSA83_23750 [Verrucomicrobiota bacterium]|jgi:hypothetical protein